MDDHGLECWSGAVESWECDENGHLNIRFHLAKQMEALAGLAAELGMPRAFARRAEATLVVRDHHIRFLKEARPGAGLVIAGGVLDLGEADARLLLVMRHLSGEVAAVFQTVVEHVTARELRPFPWPDRIREGARRLMLAVPPELAPRSLGVEPVQSQASLSRAVELGLRRGALGVVARDECDVFGRMRAEMFMGRLVQGMTRLTPPASGAASSYGAAALEYRLLYVDWPRAGDRVEQRAALVGCDRRVRHTTHWLLDPDTGRPWAAAQAVVATFDRETRKIVTLSPEDQAALAAVAVPAMSL